MEKVDISISKYLFDVIKSRLEKNENDFDSVDDYVEFVLKEILEDDINQEKMEEKSKKVEEKLKKLGYL